MNLRRIERIQVPVSLAELELAEALARADGRLSVPEYVRELLRREAVAAGLWPQDTEEAATP